MDSQTSNGDRQKSCLIRSDFLIATFNYAVRFDTPERIRQERDWFRIL